MRNAPEDYSWKERLMVVAILVVVTLVAMQNLLQSARESEERSVNAAATDYKAVKSMYAEQGDTVPPTMIRETATDTEAGPDSPTK